MIFPYLLSLPRYNNSIEKYSILFEERDTISIEE